MKLTQMLLLLELLLALYAFQRIFFHFSSKLHVFLVSVPCHFDHMLKKLEQFGLLGLSPGLKITPAQISVVVFVKLTVLAVVTAPSVFINSTLGMPEKFVPVIFIVVAVAGAIV